MSLHIPEIDGLLFERMSLKDCTEEHNFEHPYRDKLGRYKMPFIN